jgi:hypothetical protein
MAGSESDFWSKDTGTTDQLLSCTFNFPHSKIKSHWGINCSVGNPPPRGNPGLKPTRTDAILKKLD